MADSRRSSWTRTAGLVVVGVVVGALFVTPASSHVGGTVGHLWQDHIKAKVQDGWYTKSQSNDRYYTKSQSNDRYYTKSTADSRFLTNAEGDGRYWTRALADARFENEGSTDVQDYCDELAVPGDYAPCGNGISRVDLGANAVGLWTSIAIGNDGLPVISYHDVSAGLLKVAKCNDIACAGGDETTTTVDGGGITSVGTDTSIAIGTDGNPVISYHNSSDGTLKVAKCNDAACAGADETVTTVDNPANTVGTHTSIAIGTDGNPVISYYDSSSGDLKVAKCNDAACDGADETITAVTNPGSYSSIAIGTDGFPVISHHDDSANSLRVTKCNDAACAGANETTTTVDDPANVVGQWTSTAIGTDGLPVIAYHDSTAGALKVAKCNDVACAGANETKTTVDNPANNVGQYASLALAPDGNPVIAYVDVNANTLKLAQCNDAACTGGNETITVVDDPTNNVGSDGSLAVGTDGNAVISYSDNTANELLVAHVAL